MFFKALQPVLFFILFPSFNPPRLQLEDPSSAPQLDPFLGTFSLATARPAAPTAAAARAAPEAAAKVCRALEGYAMQGTRQQLAKELLMEAMDGWEMLLLLLLLLF